MRLRRAWIPGQRLPLIAGGSGIPTFGGGQFIDSFAPATTIANSGSSHTKSNWVALVASSAYRYDGLYLGVQVQNTRCLVDVGVGSLGNEVVLIPNWYAEGYNSNSNGIYQQAYFPITVPKGTRIVARAQQASATDCYVGLMGAVGGFMLPDPFSIVDTYGAVTASTQGTTLTSGGAAYAFGNYAPLVTSTTRTIRQMVLAVANSSLSGLNKYGVKIAVGTAGNEVDVVGKTNGVQLACSSAGPMFAYSWVGPFPVNIPKGSRLSANCYASVGVQTMEIIAYGIG